MADPTVMLFDELARRGHEPLLGEAVGTIRFELVSDSQVDVWTVTVDHGDVRVARGEHAADCVVRCDKQLFDGIATGEVNAMAALLRGAVVFDGDPELLVRVQRVFPPPPSGRATATGSQRR